jgi:hypothetical protein
LKRRSAEEQVSPSHWFADFSATLSMPRTSRY